MVLDRERIGVTSEPAVHRVEQGEIVRFARAVGFEHPVYVDEASARRAGYRGVVAPPTFPAYLRRQPLAGLELPADGCIHGEQLLQWEMPICAGDSVIYQTQLRDVYVKEGRSGPLGFVVQEVEARDHGGNRYFRSRSTTILPPPVLARVRTVGDLRAAAGMSAGRAGTGADADGSDPAGAGSQADLPVELRPLEKPPLTLRQLVEYACAAGDFNAIHYDEAAARAAGLEGPVAQGMLTMAYAAEQLAAWAGPVDTLREMSVRFRRPVFPGDIVRCRAWMVSREEHVAVLKLEVSRLRRGARAESETALTGTARVVEPGAGGEGR